MLRATTACTVWTAQLPKVLQTCQFLTLFTSKCAPRHSSVHFLHISTSGHGVFCTFWLPNLLRTKRRALFHISTPKSAPNLVCFVHFDLEMCFSPQRRAIFHRPSPLRGIKHNRWAVNWTARSPGPSARICQHFPVKRIYSSKVPLPKGWRSSHQNASHSGSAQAAQGQFPVNFKTLENPLCNNFIYSYPPQTSTNILHSLTFAVNVGGTWWWCCQAFHNVGSLTSKLPSIIKSRIRLKNNSMPVCHSILWYVLEPAYYSSKEV